MRLLTAHKILISAAIVAAGCFAIYEVWAWRATRAPAALALAAAAVVLGGGLGLYLRRLLRKGVWAPGR
ncbi:MAG TPA: hypothetical protein VG389_24530 [Myxococcota bacterium]|nr:hypothetical protein [Myxococcota bacterium]